MSHITMYSLPTDHKNLIRCRFCDKVYKIDNGSSGFIRHLRCKHPEILFKMDDGNPVPFPVQEPKFAFNNMMFHNELTPYNNNNEMEMKVGEDAQKMMMAEQSANQILAEFVNQLDVDFTQKFGQGMMEVQTPRIVEKRSREPTSPSTSPSREERIEEEPEIKVFSGGGSLQVLLRDINNQIIRQQESSVASTSTNGLEVADGTPKVSREPTPSVSLIAEMNGVTEVSEVPLPPQPHPIHPFGCVHCPCSFPLMKQLVFHVDHVHRTKYRCNICLAEFVQPQHLEGHCAMSHVIGVLPATH